LLVGSAGADENIPGYFSQPMPCKLYRNELLKRPGVKCDGNLLANKTLRELSILRNTIYARYGWDGYRKPWLRDYFHAQPWFKPNPKFSYKQVSDADRKNAHFIAVVEQSFTSGELGRMRDDVYARHGKLWNDKPEFHVGGKVVRACEPPKDADEEPDDDNFGRDCHYAKEPWYKPNPSFNESMITVDERIELGLLSRAMGHFALDRGALDSKEGGLDKLLPVDELRQLSLRDLRLLRNTIYARRGRPFKSEILRDHFAGMSWYKVDAQYSDEKLSAVDKRNIKLIKSVEDEFGGPLQDEDYLTEPATDAA
jgi:hypothetical protein